MWRRPHCSNVGLEKGSVLVESLAFLEFFLDTTGGRKDATQKQDLSASTAGLCRIVADRTAAGVAASENALLSELDSCDELQWPKKQVTPIRFESV